jgi:hypothetical protein
VRADIGGRTPRLHAGLPRGRHLLLGRLRGRRAGARGDRRAGRVCLAGVDRGGMGPSARALRSRSSPIASTLPAGRRARGSSSSASAPIPAPSSGSSTARPATATPPSSPTKAMRTSPPRSCATAAGPESRTRSESPRRPGWARCPSPPSSTTRPGWRSRFWLRPLLHWAVLLCLDGELALAEPKRVRQCLLHVAGRLLRSGRRVTLRLARGWPWAEALAPAFSRLWALPLASSPQSQTRFPAKTPPHRTCRSRPAREWVRWIEAKRVPRDTPEGRPGLGGQSLNPGAWVVELGTSVGLDRR